MDGLIALYKERGMTSFDAIRALRKILHTKKIGHTGTLDPDVDGVLPICVGEATKISEIVMNSGKIYRGSITLGLATDTEDLSGNVIARQAIETPLNNTEINAVLAQLTGIIEQIPPMYSAVKVNGRKLYEYAREGIEVERKPRKITVTSFKQVKPATYDAEQKQQTIYFEVACSKGTYVRTLATDFGKLINVPAVMSDLTRIQSGGFTIDQTTSLEQVAEAQENGNLTAVLKPLNEALKQFPELDIDEAQNEKVHHGAFIKGDQLDSKPVVVRIIYQNELLALYQWDADKNLYRPYKMFIHS
ncbi:tRNA pseudouridine(55) synthase TruB [Lentilactobacillus senioris]|uniref:tRNA pseudouridine(55) synthase TruB n=1 Tax=Lentilactobacillus senioris TaxID=931534 RepID=UPI002282E805|nr:tRNA pseudouridine(55) synthase TruB [Lentilactobacillus senioris]MCY9806765.1 tRNA pseudouridine(55) synthase TruB [Lentilactobacillus senioris]